MLKGYTQNIMTIADQYQLNKFVTYPPRPDFSNSKLKIKKLKGYKLIVSFHL